MSRRLTYSLTDHLLKSNPQDYKAATQPDFLLSAARGALDPDKLASWMANERVYLHGYTKGIGRLLSQIQQPDRQPEPAVTEEKGAEENLVELLIDALGAVNDEKSRFEEVANTYGIDMDSFCDERGKLAYAKKTDGTRRFEALFGSVRLADSPVCPWLEAAVLYWGTERVYLDAWTWAKGRQGPDHGAGGTGGAGAATADHNYAKDRDGGALRKEFLPIWTRQEFVEVVETFQGFVDVHVREAVQAHGEKVLEEIVGRAETAWAELLLAEKGSWPDV